MGGEAVKSGRAIPQPEVPVKPKTKVPTKPTTPLVVSFGRAVERFFPPWALQQVAGECEPKNYARRIDAPRCVLAFARSFFMLLPGLRDIADKYGDSIGTRNISTISYALRSPWLGARGRGHDPPEWAIARIATMSWWLSIRCATPSPTSAATTARRSTAKSEAVSVLWAFRVAARAGETAVKILGFAEGATHDTLLMHTIQLAARGPVYLMDRGFYCLDLIAKWLAGHVRFIVRVKSGKLIHTEVEHYTDKPFWGARADGQEPPQIGRARHL